MDVKNDEAGGARGFGEEGSEDSVEACVNVGRRFGAVDICGKEGLRSDGDCCCWSMNDRNINAGRSRLTLSPL
jgi:hypothetical protein